MDNYQHLRATLGQKLEQLQQQIDQQRLEALLYTQTCINRAA